MPHCTVRFRLWLLLLSLGLALAVGRADAQAQVQGPQAQNPEELVKQTTDEVLQVIRQERDRRKLERLAREKVVPHFDFARMTQLALGRFWRQATPEQQGRLKEEFRDLLVRTYTNAVAAAEQGTHAQGTVRVKPSREPVQGSETVVRTEAVEPGRPPILIDYYMEKHPEGWKVFDVTVDSVSLVTNYRSQFASIVGQSGIDGLIDSLAAKNRSGSK